MSITYCAKNKQAKCNMGDGRFNLSSMACDIIGTIHRMIGYGEVSDHRWDTPRRALKGRCRAMAEQIKALPESRLAVAHRILNYAFLGDLEEFRKFVYAWADFLETCEGYEIET